MSPVPMGGVVGGGGRVTATVVWLELSLQAMDTSSRCLQLWLPQPLWGQSPICVSKPQQCTLSSQICPCPGPYLWCSERPLRLQYVQPHKRIILR